MFKEITFEEWKEQYKPIENMKIFGYYDDEARTFIQAQPANIIWTVHFDNLVVNGFDVTDTDGFRFVTEIPFDVNDRIMFYLPEDYCVEFEWGEQRI